MAVGGAYPGVRGTLDIVAGPTASESKGARYTHINTHIDNESFLRDTSSLHDAWSLRLLEKTANRASGEVSTQPLSPWCSITWPLGVRGVASSNLAVPTNPLDSLRFFFPLPFKDG